MAAPLHRVADNATDQAAEEKENLEALGGRALEGCVSQGDLEACLIHGASGDGARRLTAPH
jgi:hypothetical protein